MAISSMKQLKNIFKERSSHPLRANGFGMAETVVAAGAGCLLIGASALALRSTQTLIDKSASKSNLRQNTTNGLRLLRSEVERSMHILVNNNEDVTEGMEHTDIGNEQYQETVKECGLLAKERNQAFKPLFGIKMVDLNAPIIYGFGMSSNNRTKNSEGVRAGSGYALLRCGATLSTDGRYSETEKVFISKAIEDIGTMGCANPDGCEQPKNTNGNTKSLKEIIADLDVSFAKDITPVRTYREPALRIETDRQRKLVKFIDPNPDSENEEYSYLESRNAANKRITRYPLYLAAFARADKRQENYGDGMWNRHSGSFTVDSKGGDGSSKENAMLLPCDSDKHCHNDARYHPHQGQGTIFSGTYIRNVKSKRVRFLVDGSGSMSACILWGSTTGKSRIYWKEDHWIQTRKNCAYTRMESLQSELISLITALPPDTEVSIQSFSSPGGTNHKLWKESSDGLIRIGEDGIRDSAIAFVNSLNNGSPLKYDKASKVWRSRWGGTDPWEGLDAAFADNKADTLYFLTDGQPNTDRDRGKWSTDDYDPTVDYYSKINNERKLALKANTISVGLESPWMEKLSTETIGDYLKVD